MNKEFKEYIIPKPWGYEYLLFETSAIGIWFLHINNEEKTSLHCHSLKKTGLIVLNGKAEISFLNNKNILNSLNKTMIWPGVFHLTKALSNDGIDLLEVESPKNKTDLIRIQDSYGRQNKGYESEEFWIKRNDTHLWLNNELGSSIKYNNLTISIQKFNTTLLNILQSTDIIIGLENPMIVTQNNISVCKVGDVLVCDTLRYLSQQFLINDNSIVMCITK